MILTADWHLDDNPANDYRWGVFEELKRLAPKNGVDDLCVLGDLTERRDRHSANLINRMVDGFKELVRLHFRVTVLMGNHDMPGPGVETPYWTFMHAIPGLKYISEISPSGDLLMLPYSANPLNDWSSLKLSQFKAIFMHQTIGGAQIRNHMAIGQGDAMPSLPTKTLIYSGDVHLPQKIKNLVYVGAPHPVKFGDDHVCRMLELKPDYTIKREIILDPPARRIVEVHTAAQMAKLKLREGDQVRVQLKLDPSKFEQYPVEREQIMQWAHKHNVTVASVEIPVEAPSISERDIPELSRIDPSNTLQAFAASEKLSADLLNVGLDLLREGTT